MSDASTPVIDTAAPAEAAPVADTALVSDKPAAGGEQTSEAGQGDAPKGEGQGASDEEAAKGGAQSEAEKPKDDEGGDAQGAPEQYADFTIPEGVELTGEMLKSVTDFAKAQNLNQSQAQELVELGAAQAAAIATQFALTAEENPVVLAQHWAGKWSEQTRTDAEIGGDKLKDALALSTRVYSTFGNEAFGEFLKTTGLEHNVELIRFMHKIGKAVSEDTLVMPSGNGKGDSIRPGLVPEKKLYPDMA